MKGQEGKQMASCRIYCTLSNCFDVPGEVLEDYETVKCNDPALDHGFSSWYTWNFRDHIHHPFITCQKLTLFNTINILHCSFFYFNYCSFLNLFFILVFYSFFIILRSSGEWSDNSAGLNDFPVTFSTHSNKIL